MKKSSIIIFAILIFIVVIVLLGAFTFFTPKVPEIDIGNASSQGTIDIEHMPGVTDVKKFSDANTNVTPINRTNRSNRAPVPTKTPKPPKPLPYPRISINYSVQKTYSIRNENAGSNNTFIIITLDIRNYGYKYFDAHPTKFRIISGNEEIAPIINVSTGNTIDAVVTNNSRAKGDLVFLLDKKKSSVSKIIYLSSNYTILYKKVSTAELNSSVIGNAKTTKRIDYWNRW